MPGNTISINLDDLTPEDHEDLLSLIPELRKKNKFLTMKLISEIRKTDEYRKSRRRKEKIELTDKDLLQIINDPDTLLELSSNWNPVLRKGDHGLLSYFWEKKGKKRVPNYFTSGFDARADAERITGDRKTIGFINYMKGDRYVYLVVFPEGRFSMRSGVSGIKISVPAGKIMTGSGMILKMS